MNEISKKRKALGMTQKEFDDKEDQTQPIPLTNDILRKND